MARNRFHTGVALGAGLICLTLGGAVSAAEWDAGGGAAWQDLMAAAKSEGRLVVAACPDVTDAIGKAFTQDTGLEIAFLSGNVVDVGNRVEAELTSGRVTVDVRLGGSSDVVFAKQGLFTPLDDKLILPNVTDTANWAGNKLDWVDDGGRFMLIPVQYVTGWPLINRDAIDISQITTWQDLLKPEFKGKIAAFDPTVSVGLGTSVYLARLFGIDFVKRLYKGQEVVITRDRRQLVEWAARGVYPIVLSAEAPTIEPFRAAGIDSLTVKVMADGPGNLLGGCHVAYVPKAAPHPAAAQVFINWYASSRGQQVLVQATHQPSRRVDVSREGVPDYMIPNPNLQYFDQYKESYVLGDRMPLIEAIKQALAD